MHVDVDVHRCTYIYIDTFLEMRIHIDFYMCVCLCMYVCVHIRIVYVYTHMQTCMQTCMHTCMHTCMLLMQVFQVWILVASCGGPHESDRSDAPPIVGNSRPCRTALSCWRTRLRACRLLFAKRYLHRECFVQGHPVPKSLRGLQLNTLGLNAVWKIFMAPLGSKTGRQSAHTSAANPQTLSSCCSRNHFVSWGASPALAALACHWQVS